MFYYGGEIATYFMTNSNYVVLLFKSMTLFDLFQALVDSFVEFDRTMTEPSVISELKRIAGTDGDDDEHDPGIVETSY